MQEDIDRIFEWSSKNAMLFNSDKLEYICFKNPSHLNYDYSYLANGIPISTVNSCKDLGLYFDSDASFTSHITGKLSKARKLCGRFDTCRRLGNPAPTIGNNIANNNSSSNETCGDK